MEPAGDDRAEWRIKRSLRDRWRGLAGDLIAATSMTALGLAYVAGILLAIWFDPDDSLASRIAMAFGGFLAGAIGICYGTVRARAAWRTLRRREDRIRLDGTGLWWMRHRPAARAAEPQRVERAQITQVRLGDGDGSVVLSTVDGTDHVLTDLGTPAERGALATAIGNRVAPGVAWVQPVLPPKLPRGWRSHPSDDTWLVWRRTTAWRTWGLGVLTYLMTPVFAAPVPRTSGLLRVAAALFAVSAVGALIVRVGYEANRVSLGWLLRTGRLDAVEVRARTGKHLRVVGRVVALDLAIAPAGGAKPYRLVAVLDREQRREILAGRDRHLVEGLARWLANRADVPLTLGVVERRHRRWKNGRWRARPATPSGFVAAVYSPDE